MLDNRKSPIPEKDTADKINTIFAQVGTDLAKDINANINTDLILERADPIELTIDCKKTKAAVCPAPALPSEDVVLTREGW